MGLGAERLKTACVVVVAHVVLLPLWSGCGAAVTPAPSPYAAEFEQAARAASSDYIRQILADGRVDAAELHDAQQHVVACLADAGIAAWYSANTWGIDTLAVAGDDTKDSLAAQARCLDQWMGGIEQLYWAEFANPDNQDWSGLVAACLVRVGEAPAGFTGTDYDELIRLNTIHVDSSTMTPDDDGIIHVGTDGSGASPPGDGRIPGGGNLSDSKAVACTVVPLR